MNSKTDTSHKKVRRDSTSMFREYMFNRERRRKRMERICMTILICIAVVLALFIVFMNVIDRM